MNHLGDRWIARIGQSLGVCAEQVSTDKGRHVPIHVSVIHVMARHSLAPGEDGVTIPWIKQRELKVREVGRKLAEQNVQQLIKAGFMAELLCQSGNPEDKIVKVAAQQHAGLIVIGAQGLAATDRFFLGRRVDSGRAAR